MEQNIITSIIQNLVKLYGKKKIALIVDECEDSEPVRTLGIRDCPQGYHWDDRIKDCVRDIDPV